MTDKIDLSHVNICISSPSMSGTWEDAYVNSLHGTKGLLEKYGATLDWRRAKYSADIYSVRAKLFMDFYRNEKATHMLMIDQDMGWDPNDVVRMLLLEREFLAVAGPKKMYPLNFAFNLLNDDGEPESMTQEVGRNVATVTHVGGAFLLITKDCAKRMVNAFPELEYDVSPGVTEFALFDPVILTGKLKRRLSEDYAFCHRWRKIGGKVEMLTDARLSHTGSHTFEGSVEESLQHYEDVMGLEPDIKEVTSGEEIS